MKKTEIIVGDDYMEFVYEFHNVIKEQKIVLVYEGDVTQTLTKTLTSMTDQNSETAEDSSKTKRRLYHVMVECLQNIGKHADNPETGESVSPGKGIFIVSKDNDKYSVTSGNVIANDRVEAIRGMIEKFNSLDPQGLKEMYKKMIKESTLSDKGGAGLGLIDIVKKTGNKIQFHFEKINDMTSLFIQKTDVNREN